MATSRVVLISESGYNPSNVAILDSILDQGIQLFCVVGKDCQDWENAMDDLLESRSGEFLDVVTTCHSNESVEEVMAFASNWPGPGEVVCVTA